MIVPHIPSIAIRVSTDAFFDREAVKAAMDEMDLRALSKASLAVKDRAKRIIKKKGLARIPIKLQRMHPGAGPNTLFGMGKITSRLRDTIVREVQFPKGSPPGTPPFTHTPFSGHQASFLGFRRNLWNSYDARTHSGVAGPSKKGRMLPYLHEFGGSSRLRTWVWVPQKYTKSGRMRSPITMKLPVGQSPGNASKWRPTSIIDSIIYPARPFMEPAMKFCVANGSIARAFKDSFRVTLGKSSGFTVRRA